MPDAPESFPTLQQYLGWVKRHRRNVLAVVPFTALKCYNVCMKSHLFNVMGVVTLLVCIVAASLRIGSYFIGIAIVLSALVILIPTLFRRADAPHAEQPPRKAK
jgi:hypothetical protein